MALQHYLGLLGRTATGTTNADILAHLLGVDADADELDALVREVYQRDLTEAERLERDMRRIIVEAQRAATYRRIGGQLRVDFANPETKKARRRALRQLRDWRRDAERALGARAPLEVLGQRLKVMNDVADMATRHWRGMIRRLNRPDIYSPAQIREAHEIAKRTAYYRNTFGNVRSYLDGQVEEGSLGRWENMAALVDRLGRDGTNTVIGLMTGASLGRGGRVVESVREDFGAALNGLRFNRNTLRLSSTAHIRGLYSAALARIAQGVGVVHFMFLVPGERDVDPSGLTAQELFQVRLGIIEANALDLGTWTDFVAAILDRPRAEVAMEARSRAARGIPGSPQDATAADIRRALARMVTQAEPVKTWPERFREESAKRRGLQVSWTSALPIHPGSQEIYVPIPPSLVRPARQFSRWARSGRRQAAA